MGAHGERAGRDRGVTIVSASGPNTLITATSGAVTTAFTLTGSFAAGGFTLASDGHSGTLITHS
jgi:hypothetical protein